MKILIATDGYKFNTGGVTTSILALSAGLRGRGHEVKILAPSDCYKSFRDGDDYFIKSIPAFYYPDMRFVFSFHDPLVSELEEWHPDIIHVQTEGAAYILSKRIMKHCNVPIVMSCHTDYAHFVFGRMKSIPPVKAFMTGMGKIMYKDAAEVIAPSQKAQNFPVLSAIRERVAVIPNSIDLEKYQRPLSAEDRCALRESVGIAADAKVLVSVSRVSKEKNIREIVAFFPHLLEKMPDVKLLIVGDGPDKEHIEKQVEKLNIENNVIFTGKIPSEEVWRYYNIGDIFVSASTFEVHSMCYLEALAQGLPLLCRADDALLGVLDHDYNGMIYHSQEEFADFAYKMLSDGELRELMSKRSLERSERFSIEAFADSMLRIYEEVLEKNKKSSE